MTNSQSLPLSIHTYNILSHSLHKLSTIHSFTIHQCLINWVVCTVALKKSWHWNKLCWAYYDVPPSIQADRHPSRQLAACARGQAAQNGQQTKGLAVQAGSRRRGRRFRHSADGGGQFSALGRLVQAL